jgi:hypothetical protein
VKECFVAAGFALFVGGLALVHVPSAMGAAGLLLLGAGVASHFWEERR